MSWSRMWSILFAFFLHLTLVLSYQQPDQQWPVPYKRFDSRPDNDPYCKARFPFCPLGRKNGSMPEIRGDDLIEVYALKAPVFEFVLGDLLGKFHVIHDAIGFKNMRSGLNYTMEWYELDELFNCTFPHVLKNDSFIWCNLGASCIYDGIDDKHWSQNGTLAKIGEMTGNMFTNFFKWVKDDNRTGIYYETWTVEQEPAGKMWFDSYDCASFVVRALQKMGDLGVKFNQSVKLNYTRIHLYSDEPQYLGPPSAIFGPKGNKTIATGIIDFYKNFQAHQSFWKLIESALASYLEIFVNKQFYLFYNFEYWLLPMKSPFLRLDFNEVPLPNNNLNKH